MAATTTETVQFPSDQFTIRAFLARPIAGAPAPAVITLHEWWGLNDHAKSVAQRFANEGYAALAVDLYSRQGSKVTADPAEATTLMNALSSQGVLRDLNAAAGYLKTRPFIDGSRLGAVGFSMGGTLALTLASHNTNLRAAVAFYGKIPPIETIEYFVCPLLYHYGAKDTWVTSQEIERLREGLAKFRKPGEVAVYPAAAHGFFTQSQPDAYRAEDASQAWSRTLQFLAAHLW